jgi:hypothetical protein
MKKLIEELSGVGEVFENENSLGNINYISGNSWWRRRT